MGNKTFSETRLLTEALAAIQERLPETWSAQLATELAAQEGRIDGVIELRDPEGRLSYALIEVKPRVEPKDVPAIAEQMKRLRAPGSGATWVLATRFVSPRLRERLKEWDIGYVDPTGNLRMTLDEPALFIQDVGAARDPGPKEPRRLRSLKGRGAGRAVRALCDFRPPFGIRELAAAAETPAPTLSKVASLLEREAILEREGTRGRISTVDWRALLIRWAQDYSLVRSNRTGIFLEPRGLRALLGKLKAAGIRYAVTGSLAGVRVAPITEPRLATVYVAEIERAASALGLRRAETGGNVLLLEPFDRVVFERTEEGDGVIYAAPSQAAVDLMTGPGRSPAEGEAMLVSMAENEGRWRRTIATS